MISSGVAEIETWKVGEFLKEKGVASRYHLFVMKKRMAKRLMYMNDHFDSPEVLERILSVCKLPWYYYTIERFSKKWHSFVKFIQHPFGKEEKKNSD